MECSDQKTYLAKVGQSAQKPRCTLLSRPRQPFWGPLAVILDCEVFIEAGGKMLQAVRRCRWWACAPFAARLALFILNYIFWNRKTICQQHSSNMEVNIGTYLGRLSSNCHNSANFWAMKILFTKKLVRIPHKIDWYSHQWLQDGKIWKFPFF